LSGIFNVIYGDRGKIVVLSVQMQKL